MYEGESIHHSRLSNPELHWALSLAIKQSNHAIKVYWTQQWTSQIANYKLEQYNHCAFTANWRCSLGLREGLKEHWKATEGEWTRQSVEDSSGESFDKETEIIELNNEI